MNVGLVGHAISSMESASISQEDTNVLVNLVMSWMPMGKLVEVSDQLISFRLINADFCTCVLFIRNQF